MEEGALPGVTRLMASALEMLDGEELEECILPIDGRSRRVRLMASVWCVLEEIAVLEATDMAVLVEQAAAMWHAKPLGRALELFAIRYWRDRLCGPGPGLSVDTDSYAADCEDR